MNEQQYEMRKEMRKATDKLRELGLTMSDALLALIEPIPDWDWPERIELEPIPASPARRWRRPGTAHEGGGFATTKEIIADLKGERE